MCLYVDLSEYSRTWIVTFAPMAMSVFTTNITTMEDDIVENNETVTIFLSSQDPSVDILTPMEQIVFIDEDSKFMLYNTLAELSTGMINTFSQNLKNI